MKLLYIILFAGIVPIYVFPQEVTLTGTIYNEEEETVLANVNILIHSKETNKLVTFGIADASGNFGIKVNKDKARAATITFSYLGFHSLRQDLTGENQIFRIAMKPDAIRIQEVKVKAPRIRAQGDTLVYNVGSYAKEYDKTIGDVLKRMPGIEVKESGQIHFNGTPINKFYIEGSDLLEGRYGIATNSISSEDISVVEVLQDHQPIRALEGLSFSDRAAINLKLKEGSRHKWISTLQAGMGFTPFLWSGQLTAMKFTKNLQTINTYKTNNTGTDVTREFQSFDLKEWSNRSYRLPDYITLTPPSSLGLDRKRELLNRTHQVSTNNLTKLRREFELKINSSYMDHRETRDQSTEYVYYETQGDTTVISESEDSRYHQKSLTFGIILEANKSRYNLTNKLTGNMSWTDRNISVTGSYPNQQKGSSPHHQLTNDLYMLKRFGKDFLTLESYTLYQQHPQNLSVSRHSSLQSQHVDQWGFFTNNKAGYGVTLGDALVTSTAGISLMQKSLDTQLTGIDLPDFLYDNDTRLGYVHTYLTPQIEYEFRQIKTTFSLPVNYYTYRYKDREAKGQLNYHTFLLAPELYLHMDLTSQLTLTMSGRVGKTNISDQLFYPALILNDYRSLSEGLPEFSHHKQKSISGSLSYKRPLNEFFSNLSVIRSWEETPYTLTQSFTNEYLISSYLPDTHKSRNWFVYGFLNKGVEWIKGYFFLNASYFRNDALLVRNDSRIPYTRNTLHISPRIESNPTRWMMLNYAVNYHFQTLSLEDSSENIENSSFHQTLLLRIIPSSKFHIGLRGEHYSNELSPDRKKHFLLTDLNITYKLSKTTEITLDITNIFNQKNYSYLSFSDEASTVYRSYRIRPRNLLLSTYLVF